MSEHDTTATPNTNWYAIHYTALAPAGLPAIVQAARVVRYSDDTGTWVVALWDATDHPVSASVLRVPANQILAIAQHSDMGSAAHALAGS